MNYKKAWNHIQILYNTVQDELIISQKGRLNGGTVITYKAKDIIEKYKLFQNYVKKYTQNRFEELFINNDIDLIQEKANKNEI
jgi:molybdate transport repressor ModE-like protein